MEDRKQDIEELEDCANQAEGFAEATKEIMRELGDAEGEAKADEALEKIAEVREHIRTKTEKG